LLGDDSDCAICARLRGERPHEDPPAGYFYEDEYWLAYHAPVESSTLGQLFLMAKRHYLDFAEMTSDEAASFGVVMRSLYAAMKQVTRAERIYAQVMLEGIPHFHVWLIPRRKDDTIRGRDVIARERSCLPADALTVVAQLRKQLTTQGIAP
jgi:diadenosine tetraphosphate (Ap4A) HIT family hydrolase